MEITQIDSLQHPIVKLAVKLRKSKKMRDEQQEVVISGKKLVQEATKRKILFVEQSAPIPPLEADLCYQVSEAILKKITGLVSPEPLAAIVSMSPQDSLVGKKWILVLDEVQDPGNLGTLVRTALALGWEGVFLTDGSADLFNEKAIRAAKGASFRLPYKKGTRDELTSFLNEGNFTAFVADMNGSALSKTSFTPPLALILSNEARGASSTMKESFSPLSIPIQEIESLNVAAAGAIFLYTLRTRVC